MRQREYHYAKNVAKLEVARAIEKLINRFEARCGREGPP